MERDKSFGLPRVGREERNNACEAILIGGGKGRVNVRRDLRRGKTRVKMERGWSGVKRWRLKWRGRNGEMEGKVESRNE